jgi:hypothetical protein
MAEGVSLTAHQRKWLERLQPCEASGKSYSVYAAEQGYPIRTLYDAKKVLVRKGALPGTPYRGFARVETGSKAVSGDCCIQLPNGVSVVVSGAVDAVALSRILTTAARLE